jgi:hypothetical protein
VRPYHAFLEVYIGRLDDSRFSWDGGNWQGNVPHRLSPYFPPVGANGEFREVTRRIESGRYDGKQTDWSGWTARVSKTDIAELIDTLYADYSQSSELRHIETQLDELRAYVEDLEDGPPYALVATESG